MRYIKTYELQVEEYKFRPEYKYTISEFLDNKYWKFQNSRTDSIMKVEKIKDNLFQIFNLDLITNRLDKLDWFDMYMIRELLNQKDLILRPATTEEIEQIETIIDSEKYNL